jgi:hypothetical protein
MLYNPFFVVGAGQVLPSFSSIQITEFEVAGFFFMCSSTGMQPTVSGIGTWVKMLYNSLLVVGVGQVLPCSSCIQVAEFEVAGFFYANVLAQPTGGDTTNIKILFIFSYRGILTKFIPIIVIKRNDWLPLLL